MSKGVSLLLLTFTATANATPIDVYALNHSITNPLDTGVDVTAGNVLTINVDYNDMWGAGVADRVSNADGLGAPFGGDYGLYTYDGFSFRYGSLVGQIDSGDFFFVGTSFSQQITQSGRLHLAYWDSYYPDNFDNVTALIADINTAPVPEPATMMLFGIGLLGLAGVSRRKK